MTPREGDVYNFIKKEIRGDLAPSASAISKRFEIGTTWVQECLNSLEYKGHIKRGEMVWLQRIKLL